MFNAAELAIDLIQNGKKQFINTYITNPALKEAWTDYVNSQTAFLNSVIRTSYTVMTSVVNKNWDAWTTQNKKS